MRWRVTLHMLVAEIERYNVFQPFDNVVFDIRISSLIYRQTSRGVRIEEVAEAVINTAFGDD